MSGLDSLMGITYAVAMADSAPSSIGLITLGTKQTGERSAGNPHAPFEVAGTGNGATDHPTRARRGKPRTQTRAILRATAPVLDPTGPRSSLRKARFGNELQCPPRYKLDRLPRRARCQLEAPRRPFRCHEAGPR